jgi:methionyl-tRNA formyltransferase
MTGIEGTRIAYAGTPEFAVSSLAMLIGTGAEIPFVLTQPDRRSGRGRKLVPSPVKALALTKSLRVVQPERLWEPDFLNTLGAPPDVLLVAAYGLLLPEWLLNWPRIGCINVHASLLPRWRGASPIQTAILAGDQNSGISIMRMERGLDTGPVYARHTIPINSTDNAATLHDRLAALGAEAAARVLPEILSGSAKAEPQSEQAATYAPKLSKADAPLNWNLGALELARRVRAFNPWPVAEAQLTNGKRLRIWQACALPGGTPALPGTIVEFGHRGIEVASGSGSLLIEKLQAPGSKVISATAYLASQDLRGIGFASAHQ